MPGSPPYLPELVAAKAEEEQASTESAPLPGAGREPSPGRLARDLAGLHAMLDAAQDGSALPEQPSAEPHLHDLLVRLRLGG